MRGRCRRGEMRSQINNPRRDGGRGGGKERKLWQEQIYKPRKRQPNKRALN